ncbi:hypothetical protein HAX54_051529 [Datura stramonium]|uniref:SH3 domain-containing protein n=1 Tax=Datura stramonium TaxID=4076 RepID=A0ABS8WSF2_DATST|nr:hypothetical protein [Datura stramonium]
MVTQLTKMEEKYSVLSSENKKLHERLERNRELEQDLVKVKTELEKSLLWIASSKFLTQPNKSKGPILKELGEGVDDQNKLTTISFLSSHEPFPLAKIRLQNHVSTIFSVQISKSLFQIPIESSSTPTSLSTVGAKDRSDLPDFNDSPSLLGPLLALEHEVESMPEGIVSGSFFLERIFPEEPDQTSPILALGDQIIVQSLTQMAQGWSKGKIIYMSDDPSSSNLSSPKWAPTPTWDGNPGA